MNLKRTIYLVVLIMSIAAQQARAQSYTDIAGVINKYTSVTAILSDDDNNVDSVVVTNSAEFLVNDTVMLYCVKGATIGTNHDSTYLPGAWPYPPGDEAQAPRNTGRYALLRITEKIGNTLVFNVTINEEIKPMGPGEVAQLIKVRSFRYANVTSAGLGADPWDPATGTGGVVALFVHGVLRLNGHIDVSGDGFKGAAGSTDALYPYNCSSDDTLSFYEPFYLNDSLRAGLKGEGITDTLFYYNRGKASNINGGGGGNGLHAGGGGGSNYTAGVRGGGESKVCPDTGVSITGGAGGFDLGRNGWYYLNNNLDRSNRIFFGGGGGSGTQTIPLASTDGGNGGGIVVIVADTIEGNEHYIRANGGDVIGTAVDGGAGAGGGGGGAIILEVSGYQSTLYLSATGGDGGNSSGTDTTGMGGAGGGGIYWLAGDNHTEISASFATGINGVFESPIPIDPLDSPNPPFQVNELEAPLRGFIFNPVPSDYTYCSDVDPDPIITSDPRGGVEPYTYRWIDSTRIQGSWENAPGVNDQRDYDPSVLSDTTYYRRILTSSNGLVDTSFVIAVYIHEAIAGNTIAANDTVCYDFAPELFESTGIISGGYPGVTYNYKWQHMPDGAGDYSDITSTITEPTYQAPALTTSTNYRRIAYAGVCVSTSNTERVVVLPTLTGNDITPNDTICINTIPDLISGPVPSGGDQGDLRYLWMDSTSTQDWTNISGETTLSYQSPALDQTTYIRRVVLSGNDDACRDTSAYVEILNVPAITNNSITSSDQTLCQEDQADLLSGSPPGGGYLGQYNYTWISSTDQSSWVPASGPLGNDMETGFDPGVMSGDTTWYSRVVGSGGLELVCKDTTSVFIVIEVIPSITNNYILSTLDSLCQREDPEIILASIPAGGATVAGNDPTRTYRWEVAETEGEPGSGDWTHPSGATAPDYLDPNVLSTDDDRWYRRIVTSGLGGECVSVSDTMHLEVHSEITANLIDVAQAICFNDSRGLRNDTLTGGEAGISPVYTWRGWLGGETQADAVDIPGSNQIQYMSGPYTDPGTLIYNYDRVVEIGACRDTSNAMLVTIMQLPGGALTDPGFDICEQDTSLWLDLNMGDLSVGHYITPWEVYLTDGVHAFLIGPGSLDLDMDTMGVSMSTEDAPQVSYTYEIESISYYPEDGYACISPAGNLTGNPVLVNVFRRPGPSILPDNVGDIFEVCNDTALLVMNPDNGTLSYWSEPAASVSFSPGAGENEMNVSIPDNAGDYGAYRIFIMSEAGNCAGMDSIDLHFFEQPAPASAIPEMTLWLADSVHLRADPATAGIGTWERINGKGDIDDPNDSNTLVENLGLDEDNIFKWTVTNGENEGTCSTSDTVTIVRRHEVKNYNGFSPNGDMSNEYFIMQGLPYADEFSVSFFNSLGSTVRTITNENVGEIYVDPGLISNGLREDEMVVWDGLSSNGNPVPSGTYYFVLTYITYEAEGQRPFDKTGYVVVERE